MTAQDQQSRAEFEAFWRKEMNVEAMDLARTNYPMTPQEKQQYLCHETNRSWLTWQAARALPAGVEPAFTRRHEDICGDEVGPPEFGYSAAQVLTMGRVPPGWQVVPVEPDDKMLAAGEAEIETWQHDVTASGVFGAMLAAAPRPPAVQEVVTGPCGQCKDSRVPCQCALDTILRERGLIAVSRESFQHMVNKIAVTRTPACWCATCDSAASPFGIPTRMSLCQKCGDKRCPRAQHHDSDCFASPKAPAP